MYLQDLIGMEFEQIEKISSPEQGGYAAVWDDVQNRAVRTFRRDVIGQFNNRAQEAYKLKQVVQTVDMSKYLDIVQEPTTNSYPNWYGHTIELNNQDDQCVCSNMQTIYVQEINYYITGSSPTPVDLAVIDADLGNILWEVSVTGQAGWNKQVVEMEFWDSRRVFVVMNGDMSTFASQNISDFNLMGFYQDLACGDCAGVSGYGFWFNGWGACDCTSQVQGVVYSGNPQTPAYGLNIFGVSAVFSIRCSYGGVICKNKDHFADAWKLCLALEMLNQRIYTSRLNRWTTVDIDKAKELMAVFEAQYRGGKAVNDKGEVFGREYEGALESAVRSIYLNTSDCCIQCDSDYVWRESQF